MSTKKPKGACFFNIKGVCTVCEYRPADAWCSLEIGKLICNYCFAKADEEKPCVREWDDSPWPWTFAKHKKQAFLEVSVGDWWCVNDHTGCIWNDGNNVCGHEGESMSPLEGEDAYTAGDNEIPELCFRKENLARELVMLESASDDEEDDDESMPPLEGDGS